MLYKKLVVMIIIQLSEHNGKLSSLRRKQGNYLVIPIYGSCWDMSHHLGLCLDVLFHVRLAEEDAHEVIDFRYGDVLVARNCLIVVFRFYFFNEVSGCGDYFLV